MRRRFAALALGLAARLVLCAPASKAFAKTFYWISHGSPADPVWTYFLAGAKQWAEDTGNTVNTSFHSGDVPSHQEAVRAAIAAKADGIVSSRTARPSRRRRGVLSTVVIASVGMCIGGPRGTTWQRNGERATGVPPLARRLIQRPPCRCHAWPSYDGAEADRGPQ